MALLACVPAVVRAEQPSIVARPGTIALGATLGASSYPDGSGDEAPANWISLRTRAAWVPRAGWQVAAETLSAVRQAQQVERLGSPPYPPGSTRPVEAFGGAFLEGTRAWGNAAIRLVVGWARPGAFGRGPLAEPRFPNLEEPGGRRDDGLNLA